MAPRLSDAAKGIADTYRKAKPVQELEGRMSWHRFPVHHLPKHAIRLNGVGFELSP